MPEKTTATPLVDCLVNLQHKKPTKLDVINQMIDLATGSQNIGQSFQTWNNAVGKPAYLALLLFKALVLQRMYNLSDVELEDQIYDRFPFVDF